MSFRIGLQQLVISVSFNQSLEKVSFLIGSAHDRRDLRQSLENGSFLTGLQQLLIYVSFNHNLEQVSFLLGSLRS